MSKPDRVVPSSGEYQESFGTVTNHPSISGETVMKHTRAIAFAILTGATILGSGCSVIRGQEGPSAYVDDAAITTAVKSKFIEDKTVDAGAIKVETLNGTVALSGFAKSPAEKAQAEFLARNTKGVREVRNNLTVRP
jgi:osmotically-inducible protein OsmY